MANSKLEIPAPIELPLFPSCHHCLSWSADGELALAAGEYVQIMTPQKKDSQGESNSAAQGANSSWHMTRFRVNIFEQREWPTIFPQAREHFSIGAEQSQSSVVALAWSPPGLVLSFYEAVGSQGKWARVAVVNSSLRPHFKDLDLERGVRIRKSNIRCFSWCSPIKSKSGIDIESLNPRPDFETRWGLQVLTVVNDDNDVIFLRTQRSKEESSASNPQFTFGILSLSSINDLEGNFPMPHPGSLFASALRPHIRTTHLSCGPWLFRQVEKPNTHHATASVAVLYGTKLKLVKIDIDLTSDSESGTTSATSEEHAILPSKEIDDHHITGPLQWLSEDEPKHVWLAAGAFRGLVKISIPRPDYMGTGTANGDIDISKQCFHQIPRPDMSDKESEHWEPISAMTTVPCNDFDNSIPQLHIGTVGGYIAGISPTQPFILSPPWRQHFEEYREQFDIDRDLGGVVLGRILGLARHQNVIATAFTLHTADMIEYRTSGDAITFIIFTPASSLYDGSAIPIDSGLEHPPDFSRVRREAVLKAVLNERQVSDGGFLWCPRLVYAAACCAVVTSKNEELLNLARTALERLAKATGADLSDEISKCSVGSSTIAPKQAAALHGPGGEIFEKCEICSAGIGWYSAQEAQCASGHLFVRCGLSFLSIQEPGISKFCSNCKAEYFSEDLVGSSLGTEFQKAYQTVCEVFDTCIYCDSKFSI